MLASLAMSRARLLSLGVALAASLALVPAAGAATIPNGNFESCDLTGWKTEGSGDQQWTFYGPGGIPNPGDVPAAKGQCSLAADQGGPAYGALSRVVRVPKRARNLKMVFWWGNTESWAPINTWANLTADRQDLSVELLRPGAPAFSTGTPLVSVFRPDASTPLISFDMANPTWSKFSAKVKKFRGKKVKLRFTELATIGPLYFGLDDVRFAP